MKNRFRLVYCTILSVFFGVLLWSAYSVFILNNNAVYAENGLLENLQSVFLAISCFVFLAPIAFRKDQEKLVLLFCAFLCLGFFLREVDVEKLNVYDFIKFVGSGMGRNVIILVAFLTLVCIAVLRFSYYKKAGVCFLRSTPGVLLMLAGLFLVVGSIFEDAGSITHHVFFEEALEFCGYCLILLSAVSCNFLGVARRHKKSP